MLNAVLHYIRNNITGILAVSFITVLTFFEIKSSLEEIRSGTLLYGRDVIVNGEISFPDDDPLHDGNVHNVHDGNAETAVILPYPGPPPEGSFILIDAGLSHFPRKNTEHLSARIPDSVTIYNGSCTECSPETFREIPRIKKMRLEFLQRRANDPDVEFIFPETKPVFIQNRELPDRPGPLKFSLDIPAPLPSSRYPENVFYYRIKITVLDIHPGTKFNDRVSAAEIIYTDRDASGHHIWN